MARPLLSLSFSGAVTAATPRVGMAAGGMPDAAGAAGTRAGRVATGVASLDAALAGGMARARLHEIYAANEGDGAGAAGFAALLALLLTGSDGEGGAEQGKGPDARTRPMRRPLLWLRQRRAALAGGVVRADGLAALGAAPHACLFALVDDDAALLRAALDAVRCAALGAVLVEAHGRFAALDLTASRRLSLAAQRSGVTPLILRSGADPVPSAAETRWTAASAPSRALAANAPGAPAFAIDLVRQRSGPSGLGWQLEWDRDRYQFRDAALSGAVVSVPAGRPLALADGTGRVRRAA